MMEFVDDDNVVMPRIQSTQSGRAQRLDGSEHMVELCRALPTDPEFAKRGIAQRVREGSATLGQYLFAVCDEKQPRAGETGPETRIVDGCHHGLPCAGCGHEKVFV